VIPQNFLNTGILFAGAAGSAVHDIPEHESTVEDDNE
tara:strand:+ start:774 stop:884 length:111 start_codon:yes stop_codon:yes gene_type:complete